MKPLKTGDFVVPCKKGFIRKARKNESPIGIVNSNPWGGCTMLMKTKDGKEYIIGVEQKSLLIKVSDMEGIIN